MQLSVLHLKNGMLESYRKWMKETKIINLNLFIYFIAIPIGSNITTHLDMNSPISN